MPLLVRSKSWDPIPIKIMYSSNDCFWVLKTSINDLINSLMIIRDDLDSKWFDPNSLDLINYDIKAFKDKINYIINQIRFKNMKELKIISDNKKNKQDLHLSGVKLVNNKIVTETPQESSSESEEITEEIKLNPIYNPFNYFSENEPIRVKISKLEKALDNKVGFHKEKLSKNQRAKRNRILRNQIQTFKNILSDINE